METHNKTLPQTGACTSHVPSGLHRDKVSPLSVAPKSQKYWAFVFKPDVVRFACPPTGAVRSAHLTKIENNLQSRQQFISIAISLP